MTQTLQGLAEVLQLKSTLKHKREETPCSGCTYLSMWMLLTIVKYDTS